MLSPDEQTELERLKQKFSEKNVKEYSRYQELLEQEKLSNSASRNTSNLDSVIQIEEDGEIIEDFHHHYRGDRGYSH